MESDFDLESTSQMRLIVTITLNFDPFCPSTHLGCPSSSKGLVEISLLVLGHWVQCWFWVNSVLLFQLK